jgi:hypothetical protein
MTAHPMGPPTLPTRKFPPVAILATVALVCVIVGGIIMASFAPRKPPLLVPTLLLILGVVLMVVATAMVLTIKDFARATFNRVYGWALLAYAVSAGMIAFAFIKDHTSGASLAVVLGSLVVFATAVPMTIAFTVARYADA